MDLCHFASQSAFLVRIAQGADLGSGKPPFVLGDAPNGDFFNSPRVHWMRNALFHASKARHTVVAAATQHRYMQLEVMAQIDAVALDPILKLQPAAA